MDHTTNNDKSKVEAAFEADMEASGYPVSRYSDGSFTANTRHRFEGWTMGIARRSAAPVQPGIETLLYDHERAVIGVHEHGNVGGFHGDYESAQNAIRAALSAVEATKGKQPELTVWYGPMPESNGKSNYTAILKRKGAGPFDTCHITIDMSEYPDRVRYEADRVRWIIGELDAEPFILDYDTDKHSGYVAQQADRAEAQQDTKDAARWRFIVRDGKSLNGRFTLVRCDGDTVVELHGGEYDSAIDAALSSQKDTTDARRDA